MIALVITLAYSAITMAVACAGTFGVAANQAARRERAIEHGKANWHSLASQQSSARQYLFWSTVGGIAGSLAAGIVWPLAIPIWFAWRKGTFVAQTLEAREEAKRALQ